MARPAVNQPQLTFPALMTASESQSAESQRTFLVSRAMEFIMLALAAAFGMLPRDQWGGAGSDIALVMFVTALLIRISGVGDKAEKRWYDARAASESIKSAAWQFAVGGEAFRIDDQAAPDRFLHEQQQVLAALPNLDIPVDTGGDAISPEMQSLRQSPLAARISAYRTGRVEDQRLWYAGKATFNRRRAKQWQSALVAVEAAACLLGLLRVLGTFDVDWMGLLGTVAAATAAWKQTKNYSSLTESYSVTSHEVALLAATIDADHDEQGWAQLVHDAEAAFSREHTLWLARRQGPRPHGDRTSA